MSHFVMSKPVVPAGGAVLVVAFTPWGHSALVMGATIVWHILIANR
jgi:hypothetical protein